MGRPRDWTRQLMGPPFWHRGHGLLFRSEVYLPEFADASEGDADVVVRLGPEAIQARGKADHAKGAFAGFVSTPSGPVLPVPEIADFLVRDGREILITPAEGHEPGMMRLYLHGSAMGMLFHQRGQLVLHGAAVLHDHGITVFTGPSGAGKSTLAAHLGRQGFAVLADDTLPLSRARSGEFQAWPGSRVFKLWEDALAGIGVPEGALQSIGSRFDKFLFTNPSVAPDRPAPLSEIILLDRDDGPPRLTEVVGLEALGLVAENAYRPEYVPLLGQNASHFKLAAELSGAVPIFRLTRPWDAARMPETIACLEAHWAAP